MTSLFQPASAVQRYLKILVYGPPGTGKTLFGLSFAEAGRVAVIDTEGGTALYGGKHQFDVMRTSDFTKVMAAIEEMKRDGGKTYKTLVIDPITVLWETLQDAGQKLVEVRQRKGLNGEIADVVMTQRDWGIVKRHHARLMTELVNLPMNVVITAHEKEMTDKDGNATGVMTIDGEKRLKRKPDIVLHFIGGKQYTAMVEKMRGGLYPLGTQIHGPTYQHFIQAISKGAVVTSPDDEAEAEATAKMLEPEMVLPIPVPADDAPPPRPAQPARPAMSAPQTRQASGTVTTPADAMATDRQIASIGKLCIALNRPTVLTDGLTFEAAKGVITELSAAYSEMKQGVASNA